VPEKAELCRIVTNFEGVSLQKSLQCWTRLDPSVDDRKRGSCNRFLAVLTESPYKSPYSAGPILTLRLMTENAKLQSLFGGPHRKSLQCWTRLDPSVDDRKRGSCHRFLALFGGLHRKSLQVLSRGCCESDCSHDQTRQSGLRKPGWNGIWARL
jgi:hypothetical protein